MYAGLATFHALGCEAGAVWALSPSSLFLLGAGIPVHTPGMAWSGCYYVCLGELLVKVFPAVDLVFGFESVHRYVRSQLP